MIRKVVRVTALLAALVGLTGCAAQMQTENSELKRSASCGAGVIFEWGGKGADTREAAIQVMIDIYTRELETAAPAEKPHPSDDDSPVRLGIIIRGLTAALEQVEQVERDNPDDPYLSVNGTFEGVPISEVVVERWGAGGYLVTQFNTYGLTTDHPYCATPYSTQPPRQQ